MIDDPLKKEARLVVDDPLKIEVDDPLKPSSAFKTALDIAEAILPKPLMAAVGVVETAATMGSGFFGSIPAAAAGAGAAIINQDIGAYPHTFKKVQEALTYEPRTTIAKNIVGGIGSAADWYSRKVVDRYLVEPNIENKNPVLEVVGKTAGEALPLLLPLFRIGKPPSPGVTAGSRGAIGAEAIKPGKPSHPLAMTDDQLVNTIKNDPDAITAIVRNEIVATPVKPTQTPDPIGGPILKQRKLAIRGSESPTVLPEHQARLKTGPEARYETQTEPNVADIVSRMSNDELAAVPILQEAGPANTWSAARIELYKRHVADGKPDVAWSVFEETMRAGTTMGQLINQFKTLSGATPDGIILAVNKRLAKDGYDPVPLAHEKIMRGLGQDSITKHQAWKGAERNWLKDPTDGNLDVVSKAREAAINADVLLQEKIGKYQPRVFGDMVSTLLKGNLLSPISNVANIVGNTINIPLRGLVRNAQAFMDTMDAAVRSTERASTVVPLRGAKEAVYAVARSVPESLNALYRGASDMELARVDARVGLHPLRALRDLISKEVEGPKRGGKTPVGQKWLAALEASPFAIHAAAQLRTLAAFDIPFRAAAMARLTTEALKLESMRGGRAYTSAEASRAAKFPELYFDRKTLQRLETEADRAVFLQQNPVTTTVAGIMNSASPSVRFLISTIAPYVKTPTNVVGEWLSFNPAIALTNTIRNAAKGNKRLAQLDAGKFVLGTTIAATGYWLYEKGLLSPSLQDKGEQQKARLLAEDTMPANHLNLSGIARAMKGEDTTWRIGDRTVNVIRGGGITGALMMMTADVRRRMEKTPEPETAAAVGVNILTDGMTTTLGYAVNQSMLKGTTTLLNAILDNKTDSWFAAYFETLVAIPLPNTLMAISRATREYKPEVRGDSLDERLENQLRSRLGAFGLDKDVVFKRGLWGRKIRETPEGNTPWLYQMLDISKTRTIPDDPMPLSVYALWRRTGDNGIIPTPPTTRLTFKDQTYVLSRGQESRLQELVGQQRYDLGTKLVNNKNYPTLSEEAQIKLLKKAWAKGDEFGKKEFLLERIKELKSKQKPPGFRPDQPVNNNVGIQLQ